VSEISYSQQPKPEDIILLLVSIAYPILDGVLVVPAVLMLWAVHSEQPFYAYWILLASSMLFFVVADSGFGYAAVSDINIIQKEGWVWDMFYNAGYIALAAALFWHNQLVYDEKRREKVVKKDDNALC
jgi:hypothetical protein